MEMCSRARNAEAEARRAQLRQYIMYLSRSYSGRNAGCESAGSVQKRAENFEGVRIMIEKFIGDILEFVVVPLCGLLIAISIATAIGTAVAAVVVLATGGMLP